MTIFNAFYDPFSREVTSNRGPKFDRDALFVTQPKGLKIRDATLTPQGLLAGGCLQICFFFDLDG